MHDYAAYGLTIRSQLALPELTPAPARNSVASGLPGQADLAFTLAPLDRALRGDDGAKGQAWATHNAAFLEYPGTAAFLIRRGREIVIDAEPCAQERLVRLFLLGPALALLLHQRNFLVLHASAVMIDGGAVAFVGEKGMGKSTMAAALHARGHPLVADDLVAVDTAADLPIRQLPLAYPGFPQLKLFPESAALLDADPRHLPKVHPDFDKRAARAIEGFPTHPLPLRQIFVLADADAEGIAPLPGQLAFMELVRHSYLLAFLNATGSEAAHFRQAVSLASRVPLARLLRRRSLDALPQVAQLVEGQLERAA